MEGFIPACLLSMVFSGLIYWAIIAFQNRKNPDKFKKKGPIEVDVG